MLLQTQPTIGLAITGVLPNTPAAKANLKANDVITAINGVSIPPGTAHVRIYLASAASGRWDGRCGGTYVYVSAVWGGGMRGVLSLVSHLIVFHLSLT